MIGIDRLLTAHIEQETGTKITGPLQYNFPARTAEELEATQGHDATRIRPQRATEISREMPARQSFTPPTQPAQPSAQPARKMKTPW